MHVLSNVGSKEEMVFQPVNKEVLLLPGLSAVKCCVEGILEKLQEMGRISRKKIK